MKAEHIKELEGVKAQLADIAVAIEPIVDHLRCILTETDGECYDDDGRYTAKGLLSNLIEKLDQLSNENDIVLEVEDIINFNRTVNNDRSIPASDRNQPDLFDGREYHHD